MKVFSLEGVILGDSEVGKKSLLQSLGRIILNSKIQGSENNVVVLKDQQNEYHITFDIGPEHLDIKYACYILLYDITRKESFEFLKDNYFGEFLTNLNRQVQFILLVGNKIDLEDERLIESNIVFLVEKIASSKQMQFLEISAQTKKSVDFLKKFLVIRSSQYEKKIENQSQASNYRTINSEKSQQSIISNKNQNSDKIIVVNNKGSANFQNTIFNNPVTPGHQSILQSQYEEEEEQEQGDQEDSEMSQDNQFQEVKKQSINQIQSQQFSEEEEEVLSNKQLQNEPQKQVMFQEKQEVHEVDEEEEEAGQQEKLVFSEKKIPIISGKSQNENSLFENIDSLLQDMQNFKLQHKIDLPSKVTQNKTINFNHQYQPFILKKSFDNYVLNEIGKKEESKLSPEMNQNLYYEPTRLIEKRRSVTLQQVNDEIEVTIPKFQETVEESGFQRVPPPTQLPSQPTLQKLSQPPSHPASKPPSQPPSQPPPSQPPPSQPSQSQPTSQPQSLPNSLPANQKSTETQTDQLFIIKKVPARLDDVIKTSPTISTKLQSNQDKIRTEVSQRSNIQARYNQFVDNFEDRDFHQFSNRNHSEMEQLNQSLQEIEKTLNGLNQQSQKNKMLDQTLETQMFDMDDKNQNITQNTTIRGIELNEFNFNYFKEDKLQNNTSNSFNQTGRNTDNEINFNYFNYGDLSTTKESTQIITHDLYKVNYQKKNNQMIPIIQTDISATTSHKNRFREQSIRVEENQEAKTARKNQRDTSAILPSTVIKQSTVSPNQYQKKLKPCLILLVELNGQTYNVDVFPQDNAFFVSERIMNQLKIKQDRFKIKKLAPIIQNTINSFCEAFDQMIDGIQEKKLKPTLEDMINKNNLGNQSQKEQEDSFDSAQAIGKIIVDLGLNKSATLYVHQDSDPYELAFQFILTYKIQKSKIEILVQQIKQIQQAWEQQLTQQQLDRQSFGNLQEKQYTLISESGKKNSVEQQLPSESTQSSFMFKLNIEKKNGQIVPIHVRQGDNLKKLAYDVAMKHKLGHNAYQRILRELEKSFRAYRENTWQKFNIKA